MGRRTSFGEGYRLTPVDNLGIWLSHRQIYRHVSSLKGKRIADFGCGFEARLSRVLLDDVEHATLVDVSLAEDLKLNSKITALEGALPSVLRGIDSDSLDIVFCLSVLEHLDDAGGALGEIFRIVKPNGLALVNVPSWLGKSFLEFSAFKLGLSPKSEIDDHKSYYDPKDLWPMLVKAGFKPSNIQCFRHKFGLNTFAVCRKEAGVCPADEWEGHWTAYAEVTQHNPAQRYRRKLIFHNLERARAPIRLVDFGCGTGDFLREARQRFPAAELAGIDLSEAGLRVAANKVPGAKLVRGDFNDRACLAPELKGWATYVVCSEVLEHLEQPLIALGHANELLARDGRLIVTVPGGPQSAFDIHLGHRRHYSADELTALVSEAGFTPEEVNGAGFPFFNAYKLAILARGKKLVGELSGPSKDLPKGALVAMDVFDRLFALNRDRSKLGWQTFGVFRPR